MGDGAAAAGEIGAQWEEGAHKGHPCQSCMTLRYAVEAGNGD